MFDIATIKSLADISMCMRYGIYPSLTLCCDKNTALVMRAHKFHRAVFAYRQKGKMAGNIIHGIGMCGLDSRPKSIAVEKGAIKKREVRAIC